MTVFFFFCPGFAWICPSRGGAPAKRAFGQLGKGEGVSTYRELFAVYGAKHELRCVVSLGVLFRAVTSVVVCILSPCRFALFTCSLFSSFFLFVSFLVVVLSILLVVLDIARRCIIESIPVHPARRVKSGALASPFCPETAPFWVRSAPAKRRRKCTCNPQTEMCTVFVWLAVCPFLLARMVTRLAG